MERSNLEFQAVYLLGFFLLDVKAFADDITCNYQNAGSLHNHFVRFSGNLCNWAPFTHLQVLRPLSCHMATGLTEQCNHLHVPCLCSILYKISHTGHKLMSPQTTSMPAWTVICLDFYSYKGYYLHGQSNFKVKLGDTEVTTQPETYLKEKRYHLPKDVTHKHSQRSAT